MNRAIPPITEQPEGLKALLKAEHTLKGSQRIQVLYLIAGKQMYICGATVRIWH